MKLVDVLLPCAGSFPGQQEAQRVVGEQSIPDEVSMRQAARLLDPTKDPLEAGLLHPARRATPDPCQQFEAAANADGHRNTHAAKVLLNEVLLLGRPESDEDDRGPRCADAAEHFAQNLW